jgi:hypothetical protein
VFDGRSQLIVYNHMWTDGEEWQCPGCTGFSSQFTRLDFLDNYDARFVIATNGPIREALAYKAKVGNKMDWHSSAGSTFGADVDAGAGEGFRVNVFLRDGDTVYRTWHTNGRGTEQLSPSSTCCRGGVRRSGRTPPTAGRSARRTPVGRARLTSPGSTAKVLRCTRDNSAGPAVSPR